MAAGVYIPPIFRWPTPWLWGGILGLAVLSADGFFEGVSRILVIMIVASAVYFFSGRATQSQAPPARVASDVEARLAEIERRLTDTQDVMIALSEKMDRWEVETDSPATPAEPAASAVDPSAESQT